jgi:hypothetical protein
MHMSICSIDVKSVYMLFRKDRFPFYFHPQSVRKIASKSKSLSNLTTFPFHFHVIVAIIASLHVFMLYLFQVVLFSSSTVSTSSFQCAITKNVIQ